ncbi:MAG: hypothetical protein ACKOZW_12170, partial [Cyanobium sp.]
MVAPVLPPRAAAAPATTPVAVVAPASGSAAIPAPPATPATPLPSAGGPDAVPGVNPADPAGGAIRRSIPLAPAVKGDRPKSNPSVLPPAATELPPSERDLSAPAPLALPV